MLVWLALVGVVICLLLVIYLIVSRAKQLNLLNETQVQQNAFEILLADMQESHAKSAAQLATLTSEYQAKQRENEEVTRQLEHRIKALKESLAQHKEALELLQNQQPEDKLYSRALKLVQLGADVEEIIRECDIPRAEAEMLIAVHNKK